MQMVVANLPTLLTSLISKSCEDANKLFEQTVTAKTSTTWSVIKFSLPLQTGIDIVAILSALSIDQSRRLILAESDIPRSLCCLLVDAVGRLKESEKEKKEKHTEARLHC